MSPPDSGSPSCCGTDRRRLAQLAKATGADERALGRLLTALSTIGICSRSGEDCYALTEVGACLDSAAEQSLKGWALFEGRDDFKSLERNA